MKALEEFKLIDGTFSVEDAESVVLALFDSKINYHQCLQFSNEERFGKDMSNSIRRISELREAKEKLKAYFQEARIQGREIEINSDVSLKLKKGVEEYA